MFYGVLIFCFSASLVPASSQQHPCDACSAQLREVLNEGSDTRVPFNLTYGSGHLVSLDHILEEDRIGAKDFSAVAVHQFCQKFDATVAQCDAACTSTDAFIRTKRNIDDFCSMKTRITDLMSCIRAIRSPWRTRCSRLAKAIQTGLMYGKDLDVRGYKNFCANLTEVLNCEENVVKGEKECASLIDDGNILDDFKKLRFLRVKDDLDQMESSDKMRGDIPRPCDSLISLVSTYFDTTLAPAISPSLVKTTDQVSTNPTQDTATDSQTDTMDTTPATDSQTDATDKDMDTTTMAIVETTSSSVIDLSNLFNGTESNSTIGNGTSSHRGLRSTPKPSPSAAAFTHSGVSNLVSAFSLVFLALTALLY